MSFPEHFDMNEWFIVGTSLLMIVIFFLLPRRFSVTQIFVILVFNFFAGTTGDTFFGGPPYNFYDIMDRPSFGYFDLSTYVFDFPLSAYVVIYFFDKWHIRGLPLFGYLLGWAIVTLIMERVADLVNVFTYIHWNIYESFVVYFISYALNILVFIWTKRYVPQKYV
ncbi:MAG TPA: hypothetical protein VFK33_11660 [Bacillales bacterium]|nr:hypothetical protein [Bacillales bacterium]